MLKEKINTRWFQLFDLVCASMSGLAWFFWPELGGWPLTIALLPWILRLIAGSFPFKRTPFDLPLLIFLLTAGLGVWASYNPTIAWEKFWLLVGGIFLYYALAGQPRSNYNLILAMLASLGSFIALSVLFDSNLTGYNPDLAIIQRILAWWDAVRPPIYIEALHPNVSAGIIAMLLPFPLFWSFNSLRRGEIATGFSSLFTAILMTAALFLSSSRGAWVGLAAAALVTLLLYVSRPVLRGLRPNLKVLLVIIFVACLLLGVRFAIIESETIALALDRLPGFPFGISRLDLITNSWGLLADYPFTGGGLRSFPGLYSQYILHIPFLFLEYSHHLYMDIAVEQGIFGLLSFMVVFFGSLLLAVVLFLQKEALDQDAYFQLAIISGLVVVGTHGLIDNPLYSMKGTPLLFLLPGMITALKYATRPSSTTEVSAPSRVLKSRPVWGSTIFIIFLSFLFFQSSFKSLSAAWYANLGSIYMSRVELSDFPANRFVKLPEHEYPDQVRRYFTHALSLDPKNVTANYRLGLLASQWGDFSTAVDYLDQAFEGNSGHRGIRKALGYNYAWIGEPEAAAQILTGLPEARQELETYSWWWGTKNRADLAASSSLAADYLPAR
jgi:putative inorganic carbon (hco3(-)) transporter